LFYLKHIIKYGIGNEEFRKQNKGVFLDSVNSLPPLIIAKSLNKLHIFSIFFDLIKKLKKEKNFVNLFNPFLFYQKIWNNVISNELVNISMLSSQQYPIILKGPSYWGNIYKSNHLRRVEDIDLLIKDPFLIEEMCGMLLTKGYICSNNSYKDFILDKNVYELPEFSKRILVNVDRNQNTLLEFVYTNYNPLFFEKRNDNTYIFNCRVEIHKQLFKFKIKKDFEPRLHDNLLLNSELFQKYHVLKNFANLPYLSLKFISDAKEFLAGDDKKAKCLKLFVDFVKTVLISNNVDILQSVRLSKEWNLLNHYIEMLNLVRKFMPGIMFKGVPIIKCKIFDNFINQFIGSIYEE